MFHFARLIVFIAFSLVAFHSVCAFAQDQEKQIEKGQGDLIEQLKQNTDELLSGLDEEGLKLVYSTRMRDGVIRAVQYIQEMVSGAVGACGQAQPDMKVPLDQRYEKWWGTLGPLLEKAEAYTKEKIDSQDAVPPEKIYQHLDLVSETAEYTRSKVEKQYVTDRDACQYLLDNMDVTERDLSKQLNDVMTAISLPDTSKAKEAQEQKGQ